MDRIDLWQLHSVSSGDEWQQVMAPNGALRAARKAVAQGIVGHVGITIHRDLSVMREAILCDEFETIMLCHNLLDSENVAGGILPLARERGLGTIVMKPLCGGSLSSGEHGGEADSVARGSLRALLADPNVDVLIPGMESAREVLENCATADMPALHPDERVALLRRVGELRGPPPLRPTLPALRLLPGRLPRAPANPRASSALSTCTAPIRSSYGTWPWTTTAACPPWRTPVSRAGPVCRSARRRLTSRRCSPRSPRRSPPWSRPPRRGAGDTYRLRTHGCTHPT